MRGERGQHAGGDAMADSIVPYNTGKIKIGEFYTPPRRVVDLGEDAELLQRALLTKPTLIERVVSKLHIFA